MDTITREYLWNLNRIEKEQLLHHHFVIDIPAQSFQASEHNMVLLKDYFLKNNMIYISKHPRFAPYPEHSHHFLELNYVYSGSSVQTINGHQEMIKKGELLLLDKSSRHSLEAHGPNDILINIIFPNDNVDISWLSALNNKNNILFNFLAQTITNRTHSEYLIFHCADNLHVQNILKQIIDKYFTESFFANEIITLYIQILFTELIGNCSYDYHPDKKDNTNNKVIIDTLKLIEKEYPTLTLASTACRLGYNKNYLSNIIKKKTGLTFSELLTRQRMKQSKLLIENSIRLHTKFKICYNYR